MLYKIDKHGQLHLTMEKEDVLLELNPPTWLLAREQTEDFVTFLIDHYIEVADKEDKK